MSAKDETVVTLAFKGTDSTYTMHLHSSYGHDLVDMFLKYDLKSVNVRGLRHTAPMVCEKTVVL